MRMSDEQVLPLQYFNIFFVSKGLIERPAQHTVAASVEFFSIKLVCVCDGRQWAPGQGTGTGTARLRDTCILNAASG